MKLQIRCGCFETNSSSTHSLQVVSGKIEDALSYVNDMITKAYNNDYNDKYFNPDNYIHSNNKNESLAFTIDIKGIDFEDGDENFNAYAIVNNWMAKIQYIGMIMKSFKSEEHTNKEYWKEFDKKWGRNSWNDNYNVNPEYMKDLNNAPVFENSDPVKWFKEWVKDYIEKNKNIVVHDVIYELDYEAYIENTNYINGEILNDKEKLIKQLDYLMDPSTIMIYADEAYSPYDVPTVKIY